MDSSGPGTLSLEERFDSVYLRPGGVHDLQDSTSRASVLQGTRNAFDFSFNKNPLEESKVGVGQGNTVNFSDLGLCGGPFRNSISFGQHPNSSEVPLGESLDVKYLSQNHQNDAEQNNIWNQGSCPDYLKLEFQQG